MMQIVIQTLIMFGIILMIFNIYRYLIFIKSLNDVTFSGRKSDYIWQVVPLILLIFFLIGYIFIEIFSSPDLMMAGILFGGSVFVLIIEMVMFKLVNTIKEHCLDMSELLINVIEARDPNLNGHSRNVQNLTMCFYQHLPAELKNKINPTSLEYAALLHDVGKLGIPESILNKPGKLNSEEWEIMKEHPRIGVNLLKSLNTFHSINDWILYHHERIDGNGYYGIPGERIPLPARIISIADTYSAITMRRSYKEPKSYDEALSIIREIAGTQLDAELVKIFCLIPQKELEACAPELVEFFPAL